MKSNIKKFLKLITSSIVFVIVSSSLYCQSLTVKIRELKNLKESGAISQKEFHTLRQKLLESFVSPQTSSGRQVRPKRSGNRSFASRPEHVIIAVKINSRAEHIVKMPEKVELRCNNRVLPSKTISRTPKDMIVAYSLEGFSSGKYDFLVTLLTKTRSKKADNYSTWQKQCHRFALPLDLMGSENPQRIIEFIEIRGFFETTAEYKVMTRKEYSDLLSRRKIRKEDRKAEQNMLKTIRHFADNLKKSKHKIQD